MSEAQDDRVLIYSGEHWAYWRPNSCGYVADWSHAGIYSRNEAEEIIAGVGPEKRLEARPLRTFKLPEGTAGHAVLTASEAETARLRAIVAAQAEVIRAERAKAAFELRVKSPCCTEEDWHDWLAPYGEAHRVEAARAALARLLAEGEAEHG